MVKNDILVAAETVQMNDIEIFKVISDGAIHGGHEIKSAGPGNTMEGNDFYLRQRGDVFFVQFEIAGVYRDIIALPRLSP